MSMKKNLKEPLKRVDYKRAQVTAVSEYVESLKDHRYVSMSTKMMILTNFGEIYGEVVNSEEVVKAYEADETTISDQNLDEVNFSYLESAADESIAFQKSIPGQNDLVIKNFSGTLHLKDVTIYPFSSQEIIRKNHLLLFTDQIIGISYGDKKK
ncbi:hypothetical protein LGQ02_06530 [Bacillus shivajii]|uniref:hypothetical protein n=1 Tax=Bacillus shivajii TaxID=1983719 RepID=UPI001CF9AE80|nr:hypothetical protein [Bacillus shivajii]UCZ54414.1 hypothetical protein LGQ02_06530 [Bacillus shivajii]